MIRQGPGKKTSIFPLLFLFAFASIATFTEAAPRASLRLDQVTAPQKRYVYAPTRREKTHSQRLTEQRLKAEAKVPKDEILRLPRDLLPTHYDVRLLPFIEEGNFTTQGHVDILMDCVSETSTITLHSADIDVLTSSVKVVDVSSSEELAVSSVTLDAAKEFLIVAVSNGPLAAGKQYKLSVDFVSYLNDELRGFYRSSYVENGVTKYLGVSQFESTDARRAFPCFDEPNMKATFAITMGRKESLTSSSNMPLKETVPVPELPGYVWDIYETSVKMSSYLVAMIVSEFIYVESDPALSNVLFRIWARPDAQSQTEYARDVGPRILEFYEQYFGIDFPLPKQDMAAIPDFAAGAMENWGLITYREVDLLYDPKKSSATNKQRVCIVIAHELAHQWFGDLVTMDWWNGIWLNEGFASYMEFLGTNSVQPDFEMNQQFLIEDLQYVFAFDALETSRPINIEVNTPDEISEMFDAISYEKGASVIRMMASVLGAETFRKGLNRYLTSKAYGNAVQDELWAALNEQAVIDNVQLPATVKTIMDTWTLKMGFPLVTVTRDYDTGSATASQERFLLKKNPNSTDTTVYQWWVPLTFTSNYDAPSSTAWIPEDQLTVSIENVGAAAGQWVIFNVDEVGYYRVTYDKTNWDLIRDQLLADHNKISVMNRAQVLDDSLTIARANLLEYPIALDLTQYLNTERDYVPWQAALNGLNYIDLMLARTSGYGDFKHYMVNLITPLYEFVGVDETPNEPHLITYNRRNALSWACKLGIIDCIEHSKTTYAAWMADPDNPDVISPNQKQTVSCYAIENGGEAEWNFAYERYSTANVASERNTMLRVMACSKESWILSRMLEWTIDPTSQIRRQDSLSAFRYVASNSLGNFLALDFLRNRWDDIQNYVIGFSSMASFIDAVAVGYNTQLQIDELKQLRDAHLDDLGAAVRAVDQTIESCENNLGWMNLHYDEVVGWLQQHAP